MRALLLSLILFLAACASDPVAKIDNIRFQKLPSLRQEVASAKLELGEPVMLRVFKEEKKLEAWLRDRRTGRYELFKTYDICEMSGMLGPKIKTGDMQAPEGFYNITEDNLYPASDYHLAMDVGYPNEFDHAHKSTGSRIMIHGQCWSQGCFAMNNRQIEDIYLLTEQALKNGQPTVPVEIFPFRMTEENLAAHADSPWMDFWRNLKEGYDFVEAYHVPPAVSVIKGRYSFAPPVFL